MYLIRCINIIVRIEKNALTVLYKCKTIYLFYFSMAKKGEGSFRCLCVYQFWCTSKKDRNAINMCTLV